eukprot:4973818-Alexandrium_andersonii.AAC.1
MGGPNPQRLTWAPPPSEQPPNGRRAVGEGAPAGRLGVPLRAPPSCCAKGVLARSMVPVWWRL